MELKEIQIIVNNWAIAKGWQFDVTATPEKIALMHSELSEALEEYRNHHEPTEVYYSKDEKGLDKPEGIGVELAYCVIRILHYCGKFGIDLEAMLALKMKYNNTRANRHGGKLA